MEGSSCFEFTSPIVRHHCLNDKRHVLAQDSLGSMQLWDITQVRGIFVIFFFEFVCFRGKW